MRFIHAHSSNKIADTVGLDGAALLEEHASEIPQAVVKTTPSTTYTTTSSNRSRLNKNKSKWSSVSNTLKNYFPTILLGMFHRSDYFCNRASRI